ncbi:hypothetical protein PVAP13_1KG543750 [Panicum virgatum]|uniref:Uncharacterized protein n=1 Tax=Panicum virgatum TaxID=38727 RepID=A0A8T0XU32_PANVG|nr:hypothetical protein PVAP13_1KG543750 [Panicum virgatum]
MAPSPPPAIGFRRFGFVRTHAQNNHQTFPGRQKQTKLSQVTPPRRPHPRVRSGAPPSVRTTLLTAPPFLSLPLPEKGGTTSSRSLSIHPAFLRRRPNLPSVPNPPPSLRDRENGRAPDFFSVCSSACADCRFVFWQAVVGFGENCLVLLGRREERDITLASLRFAVGKKGARGRLVPRLPIRILPSSDFSPFLGGRAALASPEPPLVPRIILPMILRCRGPGDPSGLAPFFILF